MKRVGPGVNVAVPMHHAVGGVFVQAVRDGDERGVRVMCTNGEAPLPSGSNLRADATLSMDEWLSLDKAARELPTEAPTELVLPEHADPEETRP